MKSHTIENNSINFDMGYKSYDINGDKDKVIRYIPGDANFINRYTEVMKNIETVGDEFKNADTSTIDKASEVSKAFDNKVRQLIDYLFDEPVSAIVFGNKSSVALGCDGMPLFQKFLTAFIPIIEKDIEQSRKESEKAIKKYTSSIIKDGD